LELKESDEIHSLHWQTNSSAVSNLLSETRVLTNGLRSWTIQFGLTNQIWTAYSGGHRWMTNTAPDGSYTLADYQGGRLLSATRRTSAAAQMGASTNGYDPHGRLSLVTDARTGTTTNNNADRVISVSTPAPASGQAPQATATAYNHMGWVTNVVQPDGASVSTVFHLTGEQATNSGARTYPVAYTYDYAGRLKTMTTWTNFASAAGAAVTTWNYDSQRGWLTGIGRTLVTVGQIQKTVRSEEDASTVVPHAFVELVDQNLFAAGVKGSVPQIRMFSR
jgi:hypothetical protein